MATRKMGDEKQVTEDDSSESVPVMRQRRMEAKTGQSQWKNVLQDRKEEENYPLQRIQEGINVMTLPHALKKEQSWPFCGI